MKGKQWRADGLFLLITMIWGASFPLTKNMLAFMPTFAYLSLRFLLATVVLAPLCLRRLARLNAGTLRAGASVGLFLFGGMALQVIGLHYTTASNSAFITGMCVILAPCFSAWWLKKRPDAYAAIGVGLAFIGLAFVSGGWSGHFHPGDGITLLSAICFALHIIAIDRAMDEHDARAISLLQIATAMLLFLGMWGGCDRGPVTFNAGVWLILVLMGVFGTALAWSAQTVLQRETTPTHTALILTMEPVFGALFALLIPSSVTGKTETLTVTTVVGCLFILAGMLISEMRVFRARAGAPEIPALVP